MLPFAGIEKIPNLGFPGSTKILKRQNFYLVSDHTRPFPTISQIFSDIFMVKKNYDESGNPAPKCAAKSYWTLHEGAFHGLLDR